MKRRERKLAIADMIECLNLARRHMAAALAGTGGEKHEDYEDFADDAKIEWLDHQRDLASYEIINACAQLEYAQQKADGLTKDAHRFEKT